MPGEATCGAKTRDGDPCQTPPMPNGRCRMHGGTSLAGLASPQFKTGRYSKHLPERLLERYQEAQDDTELLALREEIALVDARLADLLGRVDTGESGAIWRKAQQLWTAYRKAEGTDEAHDILMELGATIGEGVADYAAWDEVNAQLGRRRQLVESERKRQIELRQVITVENAMILIARIGESIKRHVHDRAALAAISADIVQLTHHDVGRVVDVGREP